MSWTTPRPRSAAGTGSSCSSKGSWTSRRSRPRAGPSCCRATWTCPRRSSCTAARRTGVGLLRTEFLLTGWATLPTENEQAEYFRRVALAFPGQSIVIRSFDLGGDKFPVAFKSSPEANPFGWRSIRVCLDEPEVFARRSAPSSARQWGGTSSSCCPGDAGGGSAGGEGHRAGGGRQPQGGGRPAAETVPVGVMVETRRGADCRSPGGSERVLQRGHQRPHPVHHGGGPGNARLADRFTPHHPHHPPAPAGGGRAAAAR